MKSLSIITLSDDRKLGFLEYGKQNGTPLLLFHGAPGSRLECHPDQSILETLGIRLIVPDRPGYGASDSAPERTILSWTDDVEQLLDVLALDSCAVIGFSGGGPYAMACACQLPERVSRLGLVSSVAPFDNPNGTDGMNEQSKALYALALADPVTFRAQIEALVSSGEALYQIMTAGLPEEDTRLFDSEPLAGMYRNNMDEAVRSGVDGIVSDMLLYPQSWGFQLGDIGCETYLWQGMKDINVPPAMGQYLAEVIPGCSPEFLSEDAHFLLFSHWQKILSRLTS